MTTVSWPGQSGATYTYWLNNMSDAFLAVSGNYAFVRQLANGNFVPLYFGEADNLSRRLAGHEVWPKALRLGATPVMTHTTPRGELVRRAEEADLIRKWNPPLNVQYRTTG